MMDVTSGKGSRCVVFFSVPGETYVNGKYEERDPGNTKVAATILSRELDCPSMEIVPKDLYSRKYRGQVERAKNGSSPIARRSGLVRISRDTMTSICAIQTGAGPSRCLWRRS